MIMATKINDQRLVSPQCTTLKPVKTVHENPWFAVRNRGGYFTIEYNWPQVAVLPIIENRAIVMVRVKRRVLADITLEVPAGGTKENESPLEAVARELAEETGIEINDLRRFEMLSPLAITPRSPCLPYIFQIYITQKEYDCRKSYDDEVVSVECIQFEDLLKMIAGAISI